MEQNYSIDEILLAVSQIQNKKKERKIELKEDKSIKKDNSVIPINTLRLIEEAEEIKN
jgi:hypothetical protein